LENTNDPCKQQDRKRDPYKFRPAIPYEERRYPAQWNAQHEKPDRINNAKIACWTQVTGIGTVLAAFVALVAAIIFACQLSAMKAANQEATQSFIDGNRAYVFLKQNYSHTTADAKTFIISEIAIDPTFENTGKTPAFRTACWDGIGPGDPDGVSLKGIKSDTLLDIGPNQHGDCIPIKIDASTLAGIFTNKVKRFFWMRVEYDDAFVNTPRHHTELCERIEVTQDPRDPIDPHLGPPEILHYSAASQKCNSAN